jgi:UDP:flavonoid glycosyltransferase YjiC (YdhE family)
MVGPILPEVLAPLPDDLQRWLDQSSDGVVFVSFGTLATIQPSQARIVLDGLKGGDFNVLWVMPERERSMLSDAPKNFRFEAVVPQQSVLAHPAVKVFFSHFGMNSVSESLYFEKPILALPIFGDQHYNAARVVDLGVALKMDKTNLTSAQVRRNMEALLHDPKFRNCAKLNSLKGTRGRTEAVDALEGALRRSAVASVQ